MASIEKTVSMQNCEVAEETTCSEYFTSYEDLSIHELMLKDKPRTLAYKHFIEQNAALFHNKTVIDVGAGTGILSLFAAKAGAKKVYAIEASGMSKICECLIEQNSFGDIITVVHGAVEDVQLDIVADIMISEWMGFYLLHESMLNSVIVARDKWLAPDGIMVPSVASLYIAPITMKKEMKEKNKFWSDVYGFDFSILNALEQKPMAEPRITVIEPNQCLALAQSIATLNLKTVTCPQLKNIVGKFEFTITQNGFLHGFACWFDVIFNGDETLTLSTGPQAPETHWKQTVIVLPDKLMVSRDETVVCSVQLEQDAVHSRRYNISIEIEEEEDEEEDVELSGDQDTSEMHKEIEDCILNAVNR